MTTVRDRIHRSVSISDDGGCWLWLLATDRHGYGMMKVEKRSRLAHRVSYEVFVGEIPPGLQLDHLCRTRHCLNPAHLEPVTPGENTRRSPWNSPSACRNGHPRTEATTYVTPSGNRACRTCHNRASAAYRDRLATRN